MKITTNRIFALFAVVLLSTSFSWASETTLEKILKERDSVLSQLVAHHESLLATGVGGDEPLLAARLALFSFRRDTAASKGEKIKQQELIVAIHETRLARLKEHPAAGMGEQDMVLLGTDALLQARQTLEELRLDMKKG